MPQGIEDLGHKLDDQVYCTLVRRFSNWCYENGPFFLIFAIPASIILAIASVYSGLAIVEGITGVVWLVTYLILLITGLEYAAEAGYFQCYSFRQPSL